MDSQLFQATAASMKTLTLKYNYWKHDMLYSILVWVKQQGSSTSVIDLYSERIGGIFNSQSKLLEFWYKCSPKLPSFEACLFEIRKVPMDYGEVRHSITATYFGLHEIKQCISNLYSVSNVDFSNMDHIFSGHFD